MVEVLVTMIIIAVALLGLAGLQSRAQQAEMESYQRSQALILLEDMASRLKANRTAKGCYGYTGETGTANGLTYVGEGTTYPDACAGSGTTATRTRADADITDWEELLQGATEINVEGNNAGAMIGARGCITADATNDVFTIAIAWQGLSNTVAPNNNCGTGLYGEENRRRLITQTIRFANYN